MKKGMLKRSIGAFLALIITFTCVLIVVYAENETESVYAVKKTAYDEIVSKSTIETYSVSSINVGDYFQMGKYNGDPILWRCVDIDENGPLMLSDKILCMKPFDAYGVNTNSSHGRGYVSSQVTGYYRQKWGSNYWSDSNIRDWLNSNASAGNVVWSCGNPPDKSHVYNGNNAYDTEAGFLTGFTAKEQSAMKIVEQRQALDAYEHSNTRNMAYHLINSNIVDVVQNYDTAYSEVISDKMFLLDVKQLHEVYTNFGNYYLAYPTAKAVANSDVKETMMKENLYWHYWLRTPDANYDYGTNVRYVNCFQYIGNANAYNPGVGVRPAFYLNTSAASVSGGGGSSDDPYILNGDSTSSLVSIADCTITLEKNEYDYDGTAKRPSVTVKYGSRTLTNGTDYTMTYSDYINVGNATVRIAGIGNYKDSVVKSYSINGRNISLTNITLDHYSYIYDGIPKTPVVTVKDGTKTLVQDVNYKVSYIANNRVGYCSAVVEGIGNYTGKEYVTFTITENTVSINGCTVTLDAASYIYDGTAKKPRVTVKDGTSVLVEGTDYTLSYSNNTNVGTAMVTISGIGRYTGELNKTFKINAKSVSGAMISLSQTSYTYDGTEKKPDVTVKDGTVTLKKNTDYTVSYSNNINKGTATATITGTSNYTGVVNKTFTINARSITNASITLSQASYTYDGKEKKPDVTIKDGTKTLVSGTDYTVSYKNNINTGTAEVSVSGRGNYTDTVTKSFVIIQPQSSSEFAWNRDNWSFNNWAPDYFKESTYRAQINSEYLNVLKKNLTNSEYQAIFQGSKYSVAWLDDDWGGSCYGMSSTMLLAKAGLLPYSEYKSGARMLYDLDPPNKNEKVSSLITYYQMLQVKDIIQQQYRSVPKHSNKTNINNIIDLLDKNSVVLICFEEDGWGAHAIAAYDYEYGSWTWNGVAYQGCIKICDPNSSAEYDKRCNIYFNASTYNWTIPYYPEIKSTYGAVFSYVGADIKEINEGGYLSGSSSNKAESFVARINAAAISENRSVSKVTVSEGTYKSMASAPGDIAEDYSYIIKGRSEGMVGYNLYDPYASYRVLQENAEEMQLSMDYEYCDMTAGSKAGRSVIFDKNGYIEIIGESADYSMSMTFDETYPTDWFTMEVCGTTADKASLEMVEDGYILSSDNLKDTQVSANNRDDFASTTFSTDYNSVFIYEIDKNTVGIKVDTDNNGTFETELTTDNDTNGYKFGDVDSDNSISASDAALVLQKSLISTFELPIQQETNEWEKYSDVNCDNLISASDATYILQKSLVSTFELPAEKKYK